jgi:hypothetical protein
MSAILLMSPLPPEECGARLREATDCSWLRWFGSKPVFGRVSGLSVPLCKRIGYRNSFQTYLTGTLEPHGEGSAFRGTFGKHPLVVAFLVVWFSALVIGGSFFVIAGPEGKAVGLVIFPLMLAFGVMLVKFGQYLARDEEQFLAAFVAAVLDVPGDAREF